MRDVWLENFITFYDWAMAHGWALGLEVDRMDNDGPYSPENCRLLTKVENVLKLHRDHGTAFLLNGKQVNINQLSKRTAVSATVCRKLLLNNFSESDVFLYGKLALHQKNALSRSIHENDPITIEAASKMQPVAKKKAPQSSEMGSYWAMMARCYNSKTSSYRNYGGKGRKVCLAWKGNQDQFLRDMGPKPEPKHKYALDRIDPNGDYSPSNCRWLHMSENSRRVIWKGKRFVSK